ncbi:hypothetical protein COW36_03515 [bacterium (Candidatus Blackallbacteria) CG17_big_fil_post_rev_8_21_14_2_50_48_46]|uniref:Uncharacterized protein n=1 Tax=bacterium (Candidatus Blackallbacteria) CG17_big_fil_post_rev_8_21_14_2_50_48_46 TaxID=2014261 RepID=A0A2M7G9I8_9BACT|nr:MAG: hypothetical protein COW64_25935 [bacterium (Candidatus Blackallbacteria) CG18_big_fil_WC_8_21_14_2_50_49_26]PIW18779.1 MAG: hypothetical protein COW36_03515 [bacterium (Candidatus Blackallbacteria) CG17_big_fil_post_rev_8_21_14_2_50_48_46]
MLFFVQIIAGISTAWDALTTMFGVYGYASHGLTGFNFGVMIFSIIASIVITSFVVMTSNIWDDDSRGFMGNLYKILWIIAIFVDWATSWIANAGLMGLKNGSSATENQFIFAGVLTLLICAAPITLGAILKRKGSLDIR